MDTSEIADKYLEKLSSTIGDMGPHAWEIMVRGQIVEGFNSLFWGLAWLGVAIGCARSARKLFESTDNPSDGEEITFKVLCIVAPFGTILGATGLSNAIDRLGAPEYQALLKLLEAAGGN